MAEDESADREKTGSSCVAPSGDALARVEGGLLREALDILEAASGWVGGADLAGRLGLPSARDVRRRVIWPLRGRYRLPVYSQPGPAGGYKLRASAEEHARCLAWLDQLGRDVLAIRAILRREGLDVAMGQMVMSFMAGGGEAGVAEAARPGGREDQLSMLIDEEARAGRRVRWTDVLERLLAVMAERPDEYAEPIARIRERYGGMFLPADRLATIERHADEIRRLLRAG
ncbi:hypothetical protein [Zavarzinia sp.]|uniref:hypothetical protein n=1 Tax=Zavarzinia sp. TaxID=2027920 RepID=UPI0035685EAB